MTTDFDMVTGAFGNTGSAIARELMRRGRRVHTLTGRPERAPAGSPVTAHPLDFSDPDRLTRALDGADTLYNTYWVRFSGGAPDRAVPHSRILFEAAARAGVRRIVHVSILHPALHSPYPYFRRKAQAEEALHSVGVAHAILRPAVLFGGDDVLLNNIAWLLRRLPLFAVGGRGDYHVRGIHVEDLARQCVDQGGRNDTTTVDAVGPESLPFRTMVDDVRRAVGSHALVLPVPGGLIPLFSRMLNLVLPGRLLAGEEYRSMAAGLGDSDAPATGSILMSEWIARRGAELGRAYSAGLR